MASDVLYGRPMHFRIDTTEVEATTVISVQGQLLGDAVAEFGKVLETVDGSLTIDLALLQTADAEGVRALTAAALGGARLLNASPYIELLIERNGSKGERA